MILLAASSIVINAGDNTGYISPVDSPKLSLSPVDLEEARTSPSTPQQTTIQEDFALEELNNDTPGAGNGTFSRKNSEASSEPGVDDVSTTQAPVQNPIIDASSPNDEPLEDTTKKVSDVISPATLEVSSLSASAAASSTFIDATPKKPVPELPWYKKLLGFFTTSK